ncbi:short chain dehydrogenase [Crossiella sp. CA-258035]|uniref:short chain dehydrogenase n=1 Tax=Crossiella sp. CA-258035 TaxID=2981138 RepID=UPI0024BC143C|nr:short chain dehydrogenase [Crossiella sp. CA-258035]WHT21783.1 short chain dehydrogenase [Crossiella sp. CA-258035]
MKVLVVGASGTIGTAVVRALRARGHSVVGASRSSEPVVDLTRAESVVALLDGVAELDAVVCCAASGGLTLVHEGDEAEFTTGLEGKLLGQVRLLRAAIPRLRDGGSVTLTGGTFTEPLPGASFGALINAGLAGFVAAAAAELPRGLRVNLVAPGWVRETLGVADRGVPAAEVADCYVRAIEDTSLNGRALVVAQQT